MHWVIGVASLVVVLVVLAVACDRFALWAARRGWIYWRKHRPTASGGAVVGPFGEILSLLAPSYRHAVEESQSKATLRVDQATGDGNFVDLENLTARIVFPRDVSPATPRSPRPPRSS
ncbi:hypothetical protein [Prescottella agglutinans]|uniref:Uncharacterized protein n=1 Tax=Prescottella agglutinans TaxID=1644129 RepID=A0ABT6M513_9NOCA|nr:hypothetical protein [Prescottella agglutinans]MDH6279392.1 hypothetical protein [Prescottella agglutinans]